MPHLSPEVAYGPTPKGYDVPSRPVHAVHSAREALSFRGFPLPDPEPGVSQDPTESTGLRALDLGGSA